MGVAAYLGLLRWPGALTAAANVATGFLLAHRPESAGGVLEAGGAVLGGTLVYLGGVVLNDVADLERDRTLHPDRPLPRGEADPKLALRLGLGMIGVGVALCATLAGVEAGTATLLAAAAALAYDFWGKRFAVSGSVLMAVARGANGLAGCLAAAGTSSALLTVAAEHSQATLGYPIAIAAYTALLTYVSTFEDRHPTRFAAGALATSLIVVAALPWPLFPAGWRAAPALAFLPLAVVLILAARESTAPDGIGIGALVRSAVFGFLLVDAAWLLGGAKYDYGFWMLLAYLALRLLLSRARS